MSGTKWEVIPDECMVYYRAGLEQGNARAERLAALLTECVAHIDDRGLNYDLSDLVHAALAAPPAAGVDDGGKVDA